MLKLFYAVKNCTADTLNGQDVKYKKNESNKQCKKKKEKPRDQPLRYTNKFQGVKRKKMQSY